MIGNLRWSFDSHEMAPRCHFFANENAFLLALLFHVYRTRIILLSRPVMEHIKPLRLFDLSQADMRKKDFQLEEWEHQHLRGCEECQNVLDAFDRQFNAGKPPRKYGDGGQRSSTA